MEYHESETQRSDDVQMTAATMSPSGAKVIPQSPAASVGNFSLGQETPNLMSASWPQSTPLFEQPAQSPPSCNAVGPPLSKAPGVPSEVSSRGQGYEAPRGQSEISSRGQGYEAPRGQSEISSRGQGYEAPEGTSEISSRGQGYEAPRGQSEISSRGQGYTAPRGQSEICSRGQGYEAPGGTSEISSRDQGYEAPVQHRVISEETAQRFATPVQDLVTSAQDLPRLLPSAVLSEAAIGYVSPEQQLATSARGVQMLTSVTSEAAQGQQQIATSAQVVIQLLPSIVTSQTGQRYLTPEQQQVSTSARALARVPFQPAQGYATTEQQIATSAEGVSRLLPSRVHPQAVQEYGTTEQHISTPAQIVAQLLPSTVPSQTAQGYVTSEQQIATSAPSLPSNAFSQGCMTPVPNQPTVLTSAQITSYEATSNVQVYVTPLASVQQDVLLAGSKELIQGDSVCPFQNEAASAILDSGSGECSLPSPSSSSSNISSQPHRDVTVSNSPNIFTSRSPLSSSSQFTHIRLGPRSYPYNAMSSQADSSSESITHNSQDLNFTSTLPPIQHDALTDTHGSPLQNGRPTRHFIELLPHGQIHRKELDAYLNPSLDKSNESVGDIFDHNDPEISIVHSGNAAQKQAHIQNLNENSNKDGQIESSERLNHARLILGLMGMDVPDNFESLSNSASHALPNPSVTPNLPATIATSNLPVTTISENQYRNTATSVLNNTLCSSAADMFDQECSSGNNEKGCLRISQNRNVTANVQGNFSKPYTKPTDYEERNFRCLQCSKRFKKKAHLTTHERRHTGVKPHQCLVCGKSYSDVGTYNRHLKTHSGEKDCVCVACGKAFYDSGALTNHFKVHTGEKMHVCGICNKAFSHSGGLQVHVRSHTGERPYRCSVCGKSFSKSSKLVVHARSHSGVKPYQCQYCYKTFSVSSNHRAHLRTHTGAKAFKCTVCGKMFGLSLDLELHMETHMKPHVYDCKKCGKKFLEEIRLKEHVAKHTGQKLFKCNLCNKDFMRLANYNFHVKYHVKKPYSCDTCRKGFCKYPDLVRHKKIHKSKKLFKCDVCSIEFVMLITLQIHKLRMHGPEKTYVCEMCERSFRRQEELRVHTRTHTGQRPYKCECGFGYCGPSGLRKHMVKKHPEKAVGGESPPEKISKLHKCDVCDRSFKKSSHLKAHSVRHTGEKPHQCNICGKRFTDLGMLNRHNRIHNGDRPHACLVCKKGFIDAGSLQKHMTTHTGAKPYTCSQCSKTFSYPGDLQVHKRSHSGEKPFKCTLCGKAFTKSSKLLVHTRIHTGVKPYKCSVCGKEFSVSSNLKTHMKIHPGMAETSSMLKCQVCNKGFHDEVLLQHHQAAQHSNIQPQKCHICGMEFNQPHRLQEHSFTHTGQKPFKCGECGKEFLKAHNYKNHLLVHGTAKPFPCQTCGRVFQKTGDLKNHLRSHSADSGIKCEFCTDSFQQAKDLHEHFLKCHAPNKVHTCEDCGKGFDKLSDFKIHRRTHTGERPFACPHCHRSFCSSGGLKKHELKFHTDYEQFQNKVSAVAVTVYSCVVCGQGYRDSKALQEHVRTHAIKGSDPPQSQPDFIVGIGKGCTAVDKDNLLTANRESLSGVLTSAHPKIRNIELIVPNYPP